MSICPGELIDPASKSSTSLYAGLWNSCSLAIWAFIVLSHFIASDSSEIKSTTWRLRIETVVMRWRADLKELKRQWPSPGTQKEWKSFVVSVGGACAALSRNCLTTRARLESEDCWSFFDVVVEVEDFFFVDVTELFVLECFFVRNWISCYWSSRIFSRPETIVSVPCKPVQHHLIWMKWV